jgi:NAD(P)-dependent dehydrogenase (short-subunit alcohol dehydrogenase family)
LTRASRRLAGKRALITGAARGIGYTIAEMFAAEGASVALSDIDDDGVKAAADAIAASSLENVIGLAHDVTSYTSWQETITEANGQLGGLNVLVNNAGVCIPGSVESLSEDDWQRTLDVDLTSVFLGCKATLPVLAENAPGAIVNISSIAALIANENFVAYNAAKAGVWMMTKSVALQATRNSYDVRVNSIHPAFIDTTMVDDVVGGENPEENRAKLARQVPLKRIGTPRDVGFAAIYLASDESSFMTGSELKLDGGISAM